MSGNQGELPLEDGRAVAYAATATLEQCASLLRVAEATVYCAPSQIMSSATIGQHVRHSLDHFAAALSGIHSDCGTTGEIDYDSRERGTAIENEPNTALELIDRFIGKLENLTPEELCAPVTIRVMVSGDGTGATLGSTLGRELAFASHHAIHHHAMIGVIAREHGVDVSSDFGKAPSTINYEHHIEAGC